MDKKKQLAVFLLKSVLQFPLLLPFLLSLASNQNVWAETSVASAKEAFVMPVKKDAIKRWWTDWDNAPVPASPFFNTSPTINQGLPLNELRPRTEDQPNISGNPRVASFLKYIAIAAFVILIFLKDWPTANAPQDTGTSESKQVQSKNAPARKEKKKINRHWWYTFIRLGLYSALLSPFLYIGSIIFYGFYTIDAFDCLNDEIHHRFSQNAGGIVSRNVTGVTGIFLSGNMAQQEKEQCMLEFLKNGGPESFVDSINSKNGKRYRYTLTQTDGENSSQLAAEEVKKTMQLPRYEVAWSERSELTMKRARERVTVFNNSLHVFDLETREILGERNVYTCSWNQNTEKQLCFEQGDIPPGLFLRKIFPVSDNNGKK